MDHEGENVDSLNRIEPHKVWQLSCTIHEIYHRYPKIEGMSNVRGTIISNCET